GEREQRLDRLVDERPAVLLGEQTVDHGVALVRAGATREHEAGGRQRIERKFAQDELRFARVDVLGLETGPYLLVEGRAMAAGHRGVFDDRDRGRRRALNDVRQRAG